MVVKPKILQIVCTYPPYKGGIGAVAYNFKKYLKDLYDWDSVLVTPKYQDDYASDDSKVRFLSAWPRFGNAGFMPALTKYSAEADVVIFHAPFFGAVEPLLWQLSFSKKKPKVLVYYHHDAVIDKGLKKYIFKFYNRFVYPYLFKKADRILCSSVDFAKNSSLTPIYNQFTDKFREVRFGVDNKKFFPILDQSVLNLFCEKYHLPSDKPLISFVGGMDISHYFKGVPVLLRAVKLLRDRGVELGKLMLVGRGPLAKDYLKLAEELGIDDVVTILSKLEDQELNIMYNVSLVNILPSWDTKGEVFGLVSVEAMATRTPVITSNIAGVRTVAEDGVSGYLFEPGNERDLADKIEKIISNKNLAEQMGEAAYQRMQANFTWEKSVESLKKVIDELL
ncbi:MAG TPA: glycosyltransferase family 4 protein [bacterium]|nr:glycosyltransferase family 4 protein [bacterium]